MKILLTLLISIFIFTYSKAQYQIPILEEDEYCDFYEIMSSEKGEEFTHIVGIVIEKNDNKIVVKPIHNKEYKNKKIIINLNKNIPFKEEDEIEFFIIDTDKVCIKNQ